MHYLLFDLNPRLRGKGRLLYSDTFAKILLDLQCSILRLTPSPIFRLRDPNKSNVIFFLVIYALRNILPSDD